VFSRLLLVMVLLNGCANWRTISREDLVVVCQEHQTSSLRVRRADKWIRVYRPLVTADSIMGEDRNARRMAMPVDSVRDVQRRVFNPTASAAFATASAIFLVWVLASFDTPVKR